MKYLNGPGYAYNNKGFSIVFVALTMFVIVGFVGLAIDIGHVYMVKGQLQNAADAGALAGAGVIYPANTSPPPVTFPPPNFAGARLSAAAFVKKNRAAGADLTDSDIEIIETGYWNLGQNPAGMQPTTTVPAGTCSGSGNSCTSNAGCAATEICLIQDVLAVLVTVQKSVPTFFANVVGFNAFSPRATAVAAIGFPRSGHPFPMAINKCMTDHYFSQNPLPDPPTEITISGPYNHVAGCDTGQWTSLTHNTNSDRVLRDLMYGTESSPPLYVGDDVHIATGNMTNLYNSIQRDFVGQVVQLVIVQDVDLSLNDTTEIIGFADFHIDRVIGSGSSSQIVGHFLAYYTDRNTSQLGGPIGNSVTPPALIR